MCKRDIQETCDKIIPFDSTKIFNYTNIAGADIKLMEKLYLDMVMMIIIITI